MRRALTAVAVLVLLAGACSGPDDEAEAPTTTTEAGEVAADEPAGATGDDRAVQDVAIYLDMRRYEGDDYESFYGDVLDEADAGADEPTELDGGFSFAPVEGFDAEAVDADGDPLPSISVDHGILVSDADAMAYPVALAEHIAEQSGEELDLGDEPQGMLVEITTADYAQARTHVGAGDRSHLDLTFVDAIQPGDDLEVLHLFGQTYPGDPDDEVGLSPHELFVQRWNEGHLRFLGGIDGPYLHADRTVEAIEGSTVLTRDQKEAVLRAREQEAALEDVLICRSEGCVEFDDPEVDEQTVGSVYFTEVTDRMNLTFSPEGDGQVGVGLITGHSERAIGTVAFEDIPLLVRSMRAQAACVAGANQMNAANEAGGFPVEDLTPFERFVAGVDDEDVDGAGDDTTTTTDDTATDDTTTHDTTTDDEPPEPDEPPPLGCVPPPDDDRGELPPDPPKTAVAWGDIHVTTFDGATYANQAAGELLLVEEPVMQIRTEPLDEQSTGVSVATAFAADLDGHAVSVHLDGSTWVDDEPVELVRGEAEAVGDGELLWAGSSWVLRWPDGTVARVRDNPRSLVVRVELGSGSTSGMMGDADGDAANDLVTRSGEQLDEDADEDVEAFYDTYVDSWRITADESLFHYGAGESTETFTIEGFPEEPVTVDTLPGDVAATAETQCRLLGLLDGPALDACIVDVGASGEIAFAEDAFAAQQVHRRSERSGSDDEASTDPPSTSGGGPGELTIGDTTIALGPEPPDADPSGPRPQWECDAEDASLIAIGSFRQLDGSDWEITVRYADDAGELTVRVDRDGEPWAWVNPAEHFADAIGSVSLDGSELTADGELYVNDPPQLGLGPVNALPEDADLVPFALVVRCDG